MRSLKDFIGRHRGASHRAPIDDKTVFFLFRKIIREEYGMRGALELEPAVFQEGVLSVKASNPLYSSELWIRRETIIERMNKSLGAPVIHELRLIRYAP